MDRQRATILVVQADLARRSADWALATGDWTAAAEFEEQCIVSEDELARLLVEARLEEKRAAPSRTPGQRPG